MQVTVESTGTLERRMRIELPAERIEKEVEMRLKRVGKTAKIKGFRPGKVPATVIKQHYGSQVRQEVLSDLMGQSYRDAVQQENLNPVAQPRIEPDMSAKDDAFAYTATFEVLPEVRLSGLDKIEVTVPEISIDDSDRDEMLDNLRRQKASWNPVDRASADGDRVVVDFDGTIKGEPIKGGKGTEVPVVLGEGLSLDSGLAAKIRKRIAEGASKRHVPRHIKQVTDVPYTISGKKVELAVTQMLHGEPIPNRDALANPEALDQYAGIL